MVNLALNSRLAEAITKLFILLRLNMAAEWERSDCKRFLLKFCYTKPCCCTNTCWYCRFIPRKIKQSSSVLICYRFKFPVLFYFLTEVANTTKCIFLWRSNPSLTAFRTGQREEPLLYLRVFQEVSNWISWFGSMNAQHPISPYN